jgi:hypothetical protein
VWALDVDSNEKVTEESLNTDGMLRILNEKLEVAFKKDSKTISEVIGIPSRWPLSGSSSSFRMR